MSFTERVNVDKVKESSEDSQLPSLLHNSLFGYYSNMKKRDKISKLHKTTHAGKNIEIKEGELGVLCSNKSTMSSPSLVFTSSNKSEEELIKEIAEILLDMLIHELRNEQTQSSDLLSSFNQRTS